MGYCGLSMCSDPRCIGSPGSGPYPAEIEVKDKDGSMKKLYLSGSQARAAANGKSLDGLVRAAINVVRERFRGYYSQVDSTKSSG